MKNAIVIPCYNESSRLKFDDFQTFINQNDEYTICFVNDGSSDDTIDYLSRFQSQNPNRVAVVDLKVNQGKAEAVRSGVNYILENTNTEFIGFIDADLSTDFNDYERLMDKIENSNREDYLVFGSRKLSEDSNIERKGFRDLASKIVGLCISLVVSLNIKDTQCGAKIFTRSLASKVFKQSFISRWLFDIEIFLRMKNLFGANTKRSFQECALMNWEDVDGSKLSLKDSVKIPFMLSRIASTYFSIRMSNNIDAMLNTLTSSTDYRTYP